MLQKNADLMLLLAILKTVVLLKMFLCTPWYIFLKILKFNYLKQSL